MFGGLDSSVTCVKMSADAANTVVCGREGEGRLGLRVAACRATG